MGIKFFSPSEDGKIEFSREELEKLLNDVYEEGKSGEALGVGFYNTEIPNSEYTYCTDTDSIGKITLERVKGE